MEHGGDTKTYKGKSAHPLADFSANINPLGAPEVLKEAMARGLEGADRYPDRFYRDLRRALGDWMGVEADHLVVGNGAMEIIAICISLFERIYLPTPAFGEYESIAKDLGREIITYPMSHPFRLNVDDFIAHMPEGALTIITNPHNPTGYTLSGDEVAEIYEAVVARGGYLLADETFLPFVKGGEEGQKAGLSRRKQITVRAATKSHALPGLRLGWAVMNDGIRDRFLKRQLPWSVNAVAEACGLRLKECDEYMAKSRGLIEREREKLLALFEEADMAEALPGEANFLLIRLKSGDVEACFDFFLREGILLRTFSEAPLKDYYFRMAVRGEKENARFRELWTQFERSRSHV